MRNDTIKPGQTWQDGQGRKVHIDEVFAFCPWGVEWNAMVRYTPDWRKTDLTDARQFGEWIKEHGLTLVEAQQEAA